MHKYPIVITGVGRKGRQIHLHSSRYITTVPYEYLRRFFSASSSYSLNLHLLCFVELCPLFTYIQIHINILQTTSFITNICSDHKSQVTMCVYDLPDIISFFLGSFEIFVCRKNHSATFRYFDSSIFTLALHKFHILNVFR